jgi:hypothetical protein
VVSQLDNLIGTAAAADLLGWSRAKVKREAKAGRLPYEHKMPTVTGAYLCHRSVNQTSAANRARAEAAA